MQKLLENFLMKSYVKKIVRSIIYILSYVICFYYVFLVKIGVQFRSVAISISRYGGLFGIELRRAFYKKMLKKFGDNVIISRGSYIVYQECEIGDNVAIEEDCVVSLCSIGNDVILAHRVSLMSGGNQHDVDDLSVPFRYSIMPLKRVILGDNIWIGVHAVIMSDVASGTVIGAGSVVTKKFEENTVIAGVPAKLIKFRGKCD